MKRDFMLDFDTDEVLCHVEQQIMHQGANHAKNPETDNK
jgi:hypothetical protein